MLANANGLRSFSIRMILEDGHNRRSWISFLSWSAKMAMSIFKTLKKGGSFIWTTKREKAFHKLKAILATSPVLTRSTLGNPLLVYISVSDDASTTIVQEKEGSQYPLYFTNKVLQG
ncbi:hypothetical protein CR513_18569, partial [Mucuna pruriens]